MLTLASTYTGITNGGFDSGSAPSTFTGWNTLDPDVPNCIRFHSPPPPSSPFTLNYIAMLLWYLRFPRLRSIIEDHIGYFNQCKNHSAALTHPVPAVSHDHFHHVPGFPLLSFFFLTLFQTNRTDTNYAASQVQAVILDLNRDDTALNYNTLSINANQVRR